MYIAAADACVGDFDDDVVWVGDGRDRTVLEAGVEGSVEEAREVCIGRHCLR